MLSRKFRFEGMDGTLGLTDLLTQGLRKDLASWGWPLRIGLRY